MSLSSQIAISHNGKLELWASRDDPLDVPNMVYFTTINGGWKGSVNTETGEVCACSGGTYTRVGSGEIEWEGKAPFSVGAYNDALNWIKEQIK